MKKTKFCRKKSGGETVEIFYSIPYGEPKSFPKDSFNEAK